MSEKFMSKYGASFGRNFLQWFPGHMGKGLKQMQQQLVNVDCIIEVHDARIPFSGRNELFRTTVLGVRPHILVLNKCDLIDKDLQSKISTSLKERGLTSEVLFTDCRTPYGQGVNEIVPLITKKMENAHRYNRQQEKDMNLLVIGVPNVGKSSLINKLRNYHVKKKNATQVGAKAGVTRSVLHRIQVCLNPRLYLLDTPGILEPQVRDVEAALRLALCASMQDHLVGIANIADYLLFWLNTNGHHSYVEKLGLRGPCDDILEVLTLYALNQNLVRKYKDLNTGRIIPRPDLDQAATRMVSLFRSGALGNFLLDSDLLNMPNEPLIS